MKKSNKLLLTGFLTLVLLISALHIAIYAKYKNGDYTFYNRDNDLPPNSIESFPNILFVSVRNVADATVEFADEARVFKENATGIHYSKIGDTLVITGKNGPYQEYNRHQVLFSVPHNARLSVFNSSLSFIPGKGSAGSSHQISLTRSDAGFRGDKTAANFGRLSIQAADSSLILFNAQSKVSSLAVDLSNSSINHSGGEVDEITIRTDSVSHISFQSKNLLKAKITTIAPE